MLFETPRVGQLATRAIIAGFAASLILACGGGSDSAGKKTTPTTTSDDPNPDKHDSKVPDVDDDDGEGEVSIVGTKGHLEKAQIDAGMAPHLSDLTGCYTKKLGGQRYVGGELEFKFVIAPDGTVDKVFLKRSTLGSWSMEECMLDVSRKMKFAKPRGGKPANFSVPLQLKGTRATTWWDEDKGTKEAGDKPAKLKVCAKKTTDPKNVFATVYVGTRGKILSVGFASPNGPVAAVWAKCAAAMVAKWQLADPRGHIAKAGFRYNAE